MYSIIAPYICEPFRERSKIGGSLLSSEVRRLKYTLTPRRACVLLRLFSTDLLKQEGRLEK